MGAWGTGLYQADVAEDVKDDYYRYFREDGLNNEEAYQKIISSYKDIIEDEEDGPVFWFALADTMWTLGKLTEEVKEIALFHIQEGKDIERWKNESKNKADKRLQVLEKLKEKLESEQPPEKKLRKKRILKNKWEIGDMYIMPIKGQYPRFPGMKAKYLLLIKIGDGKDLSGYIQPLVYIKFLEEEYYDGIDINELKFAQPGVDKYCFLIMGVAGRPLPKEFTYVGNFGDISKLKDPNETGEIIKEYNVNEMFFAKGLEFCCVVEFIKHYLRNEKTEYIHQTIHMTDKEYEEYCIEKEKKSIAYEAKVYAERKKKEFYICPWNDGDVFYLPIRKEVEGGKKLIKQGYVGIVVIKVDLRECYATTNMWPVVIMQCVKKEYSSLENVIKDKIFENSINKKYSVTHKRSEKTPPTELKFLGNIDDLTKFQIDEKLQLPFIWSEIEMQFCRILKLNK